MTSDLSLKLVLIVIIYIPGYIFRKFYFSGEFTKQFSIKDWTRNIGINSILGLFIHLLILALIHSCFEDSFRETCNKYFDKPSFNNIIKHLTKGNLEYFIDNTSNSRFIAYYTSFVSSLSILFAFLSYRFVRITKLDRKFSLFRFKNHWNYYFRGEIIDFSDFKYLKDRNAGNYLYTDADILTQTASGKTKLITGIIRQYTIDEVGKLHNVYLSHVTKWKPAKEVNELRSENIDLESSIDSIDKSKPYRKAFESDCFIIPYSSILEINLNYRTVQPLVSDDDSINQLEIKQKKQIEGLSSILIISIITATIYFVFIYELPEYIAFSFVESLGIRLLYIYLFAYFLIILMYVCARLIFKNYKEILRPMIRDSILLLVQYIIVEVCFYRAYLTVDNLLEHFV